MSCGSVRRKLPGYLDGALATRAHGPVREHLASCAACREELERTREMLAMVSRVARPTPPADLATRIRVSVSQTHEAQGWEARVRRLTTRSQLILENILEPLAIPAMGGLVAAMLVFALVMQAGAVGLPFGEVQNDMPTDLLQPARLVELAGFPVPGDGSLLVEATINAEGRMMSYRIVSGSDTVEIRRQLDEVLMFSRFRPQMSFGRPTAGGRVMLSFSGVQVKG